MCPKMKIFQDNGDLRIYVEENDGEPVRCFGDSAHPSYSRWIPKGVQTKNKAEMERSGVTRELPASPASSLSLDMHTKCGAWCELYPTRGKLFTRYLSQVPTC